MYLISLSFFGFIIFFFRKVVNYCTLFVAWHACSCSLKDTTVPEAGDSPPPPYSEGPADKCAATMSSSKSTNQLPRYEELKPLTNGFFI